MPYIDKKGRVYKYGEFLPEEFSPFAYNETVLQDMLPLTKEVAVAEGYAWRDTSAREFITTKSAADLPQDISEVDDSIIKEVIQCKDCKRAYRIIVSELQFLRRMKLPAPRICVSCRQARRAALINPPQYYDRQCAKCGEEIKTSYAPERPEIVYCESCYQQETA